MTELTLATMPHSVKLDPVAFLRQMADCIEAGELQTVGQGVLVLRFEEGGYSVWGFGPRGCGDFSTLATIAVGQQILANKMAGVAV